MADTVRAGPSKQNSTARPNSHPAGQEQLAAHAGCAQNGAARAQPRRVLEMARI